MADKNEKKDWHGLFIPAGLLIGMGIGFIVDELVAGLFIGLGAGMAASAIIAGIEKNK